MQIQKIPVCDITDYGTNSRRNGGTFFESGMVVALEPEPVFPGRSVVGIENTRWVSDAGPEAITRSPEEVIVV